MTQSECRVFFEQAVAGLPPSGAPRAALVSALPRLRELILFAQRSGCGHYSSPRIEQLLCELAQTIRSDCSAAGEKGHFLIVMSEAYAVGGHTRVVERWIELDKAHRYSLVLTRQSADKPLPKRLVAAVAASGGEVRRMNPRQEVLGGARELREYACRFEKVVLHIHTDDVVPVLAFGTNDFPRPVGLYNHADHLFWIGASVADCVGELRKTGVRFSCERRGLSRAVYVGIPVDTQGVRASSGNRDPQTKRIVTCGNASKYEAVMGLDFMASMEEILRRSPHARLVGIGMTARDFPRWKRLGDRLGGRIELVGPVPFERLGQYYDRADLVVDSYPFGGGTALPDALCHACPVLSHPGPVGQMDWVYESEAYCRSDNELVDKALAILAGRIDGADFAKREYEVFRELNAPERFLNRVQAFLSSLDGGHRVSLPRVVEARCEDLDRYHFEMNNRRETVFRFPFGLLRIVRESDSLCRIRVLEAFGLRIPLKRKCCLPCLYGQWGSGSDV